jgi:hypothetical protein
MSAGPNAILSPVALVLDLAEIEPMLTTFTAKESA